MAAAAAASIVSHPVEVETQQLLEYPSEEEGKGERSGVG